MFNDIDKVCKLPLNQVKASPSVNSPNDGAFNSEENVRWANKKLTTKPFIYGKTEKDVARSFGSDVAYGWYGAYCNDAMFSMDGYLIRVADENNLSYDDPNEMPGPSVDLMPAQKFVSGLVGVGTESQLPTDYASFLFQDFLPQEHSSAWEDACDTDTIMGFIKMTYSGSYYDALTVTLTEIKYEDTVVSIDNTLVLPDPFSPDDSIRYISGSEERTNPVAQTAVSQTANIYYPVRLKKAKKYNADTNTYYTVNKLYFTDIFGIEFVFANMPSWTHMYPYTASVFMDMSENKPLNALGFSNCTRTTIPTHEYLYTQLYTADTGGIKRQSFDTAVSINAYRLNSFSLNMFDYYSLANLMSNIPTAQYQTDISEIRSTMGYYCLPFGTDPGDLITNLCIRGRNNNSEDYSVPVSFMASNGMITPNGFVTGSGNNISPNYPVEGYMHFIKRIYLIAHGVPAPAEDAIKSVTVSQLTSWTSASQIPTNGSVVGVNSVTVSFPIIYQQYIYPMICAYMNLAYSSLMDNVIYNAGSNTESMKAMECGFALLGTSGTVDADINVDQEYTHNGYISNGGVLQQVSNQKDTIHYHKDYISDKTRVLTESKSPNGVQIIDGYYYRDSFDFDDSDNSASPNYFEDPINLLRRCMVDNNYSGAKVLTKSSGTVFYTTYNSGAMQSLDVNTGSYYIAVDDFLFPAVPFTNQLPSGTTKAIWAGGFVAHLDSHTVISPNIAAQSKTFGNGMIFGFNIDSWYATLNYVAELQKDSLNYLSGKDYEDGQYGGIHFKVTLGKHDIESDDLLLFKTEESTTPRIIAHDEETFNYHINYDDVDVKTAREAFISVSKVYHGDRELGMIIDDIESEIEDSVAKIENIEAELNDPETGLSDIVDSLTEQVGNISGDVSTLNQAVFGDDTHTGLQESVSDLEGAVSDLSTASENLTKSQIHIIAMGNCSRTAQDDVWYYIYGSSDPSDYRHVVVLSGYGAVRDYYSPWDENPEHTEKNPYITSRVHKVIVEPGITEIGMYSLNGWNYSILELPYTIRRIHQMAISGDNEHGLDGPASIKLDSGILSIGTDTEAAFPYNVIGAFAYTNVSDIYVPSTVVSTDKAFYRSTGLQKVFFDCREISENTCDGCTNLTSVLISANVKQIEYQAFKDCLNLTALRYFGTKQQWQYVNKLSGWDKISSDPDAYLSRIQCDDGAFVYNTSTNTWEEE